MSKVSVKKGAYLTSLLHALKYPSASVNGVLLGHRNKGETVKVETAVPLLHSHIALAPMMDAAFSLVEEYCKKESLKVVGYYHANATHDQNKFSGAISPAMAVAKRIADRIYETEKETDRAAECCVMIVDNKELEQLATQLEISTKSGAATDMGKYSGVTLHVKNSGGTWQQLDPASNQGLVEGVDDGSAQAELLSLIAKGAYQSLTDFDNHIDDPTRGWLTTSVVA